LNNPIEAIWPWFEKWPKTFTAPGMSNVEGTWKLAKSPLRGQSRDSQLVNSSHDRLIMRDAADSLAFGRQCQERSQRPESNQKSTRLIGIPSRTFVSSRCWRNASRSEIKKRQEEWKDVAGVAVGFDCERERAAWVIMCLVE
jgi:hypothetical protein